MSYFHINEAKLVLSCANKLDINLPLEGRINCLFSMIIIPFFPNYFTFEKGFLLLF